MLSSFSHFSTRGLFIIYALLVSPVYGNNLADQLPDIGTAGASTLTPREEKQLGQEFMRNIRQNLQLMDDPLSVSYLQSLADKLQPKLRETGIDITVFLIDDPSINAFAGPGGYIGIHSGLLMAARTEGELASVMAHEISHVSQRHLVRAFESSKQMSLASMGAIIAGIILGNNNPELSEAVIASTVAGNAQQQLTYSRSHEQEADRIGIELLANADYDPRMMVSFFEVLQQQQRTVGSNAPEFLLTHPLTLSRIADTRNRAEQYPQSRQGDNSTFQLIQARVATLTKNAGQNPFNGETREDDTNNQASQYYLGLAAEKKGNYSLARQHLQPLLREHPQRLLYHFSAAEIELADNHPAQAEKITQHALDLFPGSAPLLELHAKTQLQQDKTQQAFLTLKSAIRQHPERIYLYKTYADAASKIGNIAEAYRALTDYQYQLGNVHQAIDYLQQALKSGNMDKYDRISFEARLEELKSEALSREQTSRKNSE